MFSKQSTGRENYYYYFFNYVEQSPRDIPRSQASVSGVTFLKTDGVPHQTLVNSTRVGHSRRATPSFDRRQETAVRAAPSWDADSASFILCQFPGNQCWIRDKRSALNRTNIGRFA